jgi:hypothetical protein
MTGEEMARETAEKLKRQKTENATKDLAMSDLKSGLVNVSENSELMKMYQESADVGAENLSGEMPLLKVHSTGRSQSLLANGKEPANGSFYYKPTKREFINPTVHILTVSHGYKAPGMVDKKTGKKGDDKFNQLVGGVIVDGPDLLPFTMYFTGMKLSRLWAFGKEANKFTKLKPVPIPLFALSVKLTTEQVDSDYGKVWVVNFEILKTDDGFPVVITDASLFQFLKTSVVKVQESISSIVDAKTAEDEGQVIDGEENPNGPRPF